MSSLFADAMRAAIYCNASGCPPETDEQLARRRRYEAEMAKLCPVVLDLDDDELRCGLKREHRGQFHIAVVAGQEVRWRPTS